MSAPILLSPVTLAREWGDEVICMRSETHVGKILRRRARTKGGLQYHAKEELHYLVSGSLRLRFDAGDGQLTELDVEPGSAWLVPPGAVHQEEALTDCEVFEVSDPTEDDRVRVEAQYGVSGEGDALPSMTKADARRKLVALCAAFRRRAAECADAAMTGRFGV